MMPSLRRLTHGLNVVLIEPQIPGNTGCVGRTVMAAGARLHLIHPLGFSTDERALRRAGLDYWPRLDVTEHDSWETFVEREFDGRCEGTSAPAPWLLTTKSHRPLWSGTFRPGDYLLFGNEGRGAAEHVHDWVGEERRVALPMVETARSINLAAAVSAALYEAMRQVDGAQPTS